MNQHHYSRIALIPKRHSHFAMIKCNDKNKKLLGIDAAQIHAVIDTTLKIKQT
jgi:hypothetical protein